MSGEQKNGNISDTTEQLHFDMGHLMENGVDLGVVAIFLQKLFKLGIVVDVSLVFDLK
jgi:hypothetical protein